MIIRVCLALKTLHPDPRHNQLHIFQGSGGTWFKFISRQIAAKTIMKRRFQTAAFWPASREETAHATRNNQPRVLNSVWLIADTCGPGRRSRQQVQGCRKGMRLKKGGKKKSYFTFLLIPWNWAIDLPVCSTRGSNSSPDYVLPLINPCTLESSLVFIEVGFV